MNTQPHRHLCSSDPSSSCWASSSPAWNSPWNSVLPVPATLSLYLPSSNLGSSETKHERPESDNKRRSILHLQTRHISSGAVSSIKCCSVAHDFADDCFLGASSLVAIRPCCLAVWREHHLPQTCAIVANRIESILLISIQSWACWWWKFHQILPGLIDLNGCCTRYWISVTSNSTIPPLVVPMTNVSDLAPARWLATQLPLWLVRLQGFGLGKYPWLE